MGVLVGCWTGDIRLSARCTQINTHTSSDGINAKYMTKCIKCKTRIMTHLWVFKGDVYCSPSCQRGKASQFEKLHKALAKMRNKN